ncbi:hypothetical protein [Pseudobythopirellula maris]|uniref:hypothetical protein n=1 Tax=Pseudobythopirellula maris TaxID=2527991 RepID=UPI0018D4CFD7|nr:hypothetical protein [Pseudobythopirellula maris]
MLLSHGLLHLNSQAAGPGAGRGAVNGAFGLGTKKSGKGRRKQGRKKRRMRAKIRHRKK